MSQISSATITDQAVASIELALDDLAPYTSGEGRYDWTCWQGAESALLTALVRIRFAKSGIMRRDPSYDLPAFSRAEADVSIAVSIALDEATSAALDSMGAAEPERPRRPRVDPVAVERRKARLRAEEAELAFSTYRLRFGTPGTISGEKMTAEQRAEYQRLMRAAEAEHGAYMEHVHHTA